MERVAKAVSKRTATRRKRSSPVNVGSAGRPDTSPAIAGTKTRKEKMEEREQRKTKRKGKERQLVA
eukprot:3116629-Amphidinium_carterae.1